MVSIFGGTQGLFASAEYDEDDKEADAVWEAVDERMDSRRKNRREARLKEEIEKYRKSNPKITEQFSNLKGNLHTMSTDEWDSIPETSGSQTPVTDLTDVGEGRGTVLSLKLGRLSDSVSGHTVVDQEGFLISGDADISDIKKARLLLKSVTQTNPRHGPGWIAAARLEEVAGNLKMARQLIERGCEECPKSEDVWVEACRLASPDEAKAVIARGVKAIPNSVKLWLEAAKLEHDECFPCDQDPHVIAAVARLFWQDRKVDKARSWLNRAVTLAPDVGDFWALYYKFELQHGTEDTQDDVLKRCVAVEPKHGEKWQAVLMAVENAHQPTEAILKKVVIVLGKEEKAAENNKH